VTKRVLQLASCSNGCSKVAARHRNPYQARDLAATWWLQQSIRYLQATPPFLGPLAAEQVAETAAEQQQAAERERIGGDDPLPVNVGKMQGVLR